MVEIRKAKVKDLPAIVELAMGMLRYHKKFDSYFTPGKNAKVAYYKFFKSCIYNPKRMLLVAEKNFRIIGYTLGSVSLRPPVFKSRRIGMIFDMFVIKKYRRIGIAKFFLEELFVWFRKKKLKHVELAVHVKNEIGKNAWRKYGFEDFIIKARIKVERLK